MENNKKIRIACGITLYNPDNSIESKIKLYDKKFDEVYIYDNSTTAHMYSIYDSIKVHYLSNIKNAGLPAALNYFLNQVSNVDYLCLLDQDSVFLEEDINSLVSYIENHIDDEVGVIGPNIKYKGKKKNEKGYLIKECNYIITSGTFINIKKVKQNGIIYDENYFIDRAEVDFCKQILNHNLKVLMYQGSNLYQELGYVENGIINHDAFRHYYIFRNRLYYNRKFYNGLNRLIRNIVGSLKHVYIVCQEMDSLKKIRAMYIGWKDYLKGKMGKYCEKKL